MADESDSSELSSAQRARAFLAARFDPKSQLGLGLTASFVIFALAVWALSGLLDAVLDNETLVRIDFSVASWFHAHATATGLAIFNAITQLGSPVVVVIVIVVALYLWRRREMLLLWNWLGANLGGKALQYVLKNTVHRSRPQYGATYLNGHSYSFPSGHTMSATVCYLLLAYLIASRVNARSRRRWLAFGIAAAIVVAVGLSRLYLGVHYPSDVLGGVAASVAWLAVCGATRRFVAARQAQSRAS
jgi:undecaprenyl-diphosphatase